MKGYITKEQLSDSLKNELSDFSSQLEHIENKSTITITPYEFGAVGDGITDDTDALTKCLNFRDNVNIVFDKEKTYVINRGIKLTKNNVNIFGNNSTIKFIDNCSVLQEIYETTALDDISTMLYINGLNFISIYDLNLNGNCDNVYFVHDSEKYYGYMADINIDGIPDKYICTYGIKAYGTNNIKIKNCKITNIGGGIHAGGVWGSGILGKNILLENIEINNAFRDGIVITDCDGPVLNNIKVINTQRKGIQFYRSVINGTINNPHIVINENELKKWYPTWSTEQPDCEMSGIAIQNPNYTDYCINVIINNPYINVPKSCINIRNYSKNISINGGYISGEYGLRIYGGVQGYKLKDLEIKASKIGIEKNYFNRNCNNVAGQNNEIIENVRFINTINDIYYSSNEDCQINTINVLLNNNIFNKGVYIAQNKTNLFNIYTKDLESKTYNNVVIKNTTLNDNYIQRYKLFIKNKNNEIAPVNVYNKVARLKVSSINKTCVLKGYFSTASDSPISYTDFVLKFRTHWSDLTENVISNCIFPNKTNLEGCGIAIDCENVGGEKIINVYLKSSWTHSWHLVFEANYIDNEYIVEKCESEWIENVENVANLVEFI